METLDPNVFIASGEKLADVVAACKTAGFVALDLETSGLEKTSSLVGIGLAWKASPDIDTSKLDPSEFDSYVNSVYIPVGHITDNYQLPMDVVRESLQDIFNHCMIEPFNATFELKEMQKYGLLIPHFTDLKYKVVAANEAHYRMSLKEIAEMYKGIKWGTIKDICTKTVKERNPATGRLVTKKTLDIPGTSIKELGDYCRMDCIITLVLDDLFTPQAAYAAPIIQLETRVTPTVVDMETRGIAVDLEAASKLHDKLVTDLDALARGIYEAAGCQFNLNSPKQVSEILFDLLKLKDVDHRSTNVEVLQALKNDHMVPHLMLNYRELEKLRSTYIVPILEKQINGRIYFSLNQLGTESGRFSSSKPNMQNVPASKKDKEGNFSIDDPGIRQLFIASPGMVFIDYDFSQIEGRVFAHMSQDPTLLNYYRNGGDIHTATSEKLGIPRKLAKIINFAIIYGCSPAKLVEVMAKEGYIYEIKDAAELIDNFWGIYSVGKQWMNLMEEKLYRTKCAYTLFGRRRVFPEIVKVEKYTESYNGRRYNPEYGKMQAKVREANNFYIQGTAADIMKIGLVDVDDALKLAGSFAFPVVPVHDELLSEAYTDYAEEASLIIKHRLADCVTLSVPLLVEGSKALNWAECK